MTREAAAAGLMQSLLEAAGLPSQEAAGLPLLDRLPVAPLGIRDGPLAMAAVLLMSLLLLPGPPREPPPAQGARDTHWRGLPGRALPPREAAEAAGENAAR